MGEARNFSRDGFSNFLYEKVYTRILFLKNPRKLKNFLSKERFVLQILATRLLSSHSVKVLSKVQLPLDKSLVQNQTPLESTREKFSNEKEELKVSPPNLPCEYAGMDGFTPPPPLKKMAQTKKWFKIARVFEPPLPLTKILTTPLSSVILYRHHFPKKPPKIPAQNFCKAFNPWISFIIKKMKYCQKKCVKIKCTEKKSCMKKSNKTKSLRSWKEISVVYRKASLKKICLFCFLYFAL